MPFRCDTLFSYSVLKYICSKEPILFQEIKLWCDTLCPCITLKYLYIKESMCFKKWHCGAILYGHIVH